MFQAEDKTLVSEQNSEALQESHHIKFGVYCLAILLNLICLVQNCSNEDRICDHNSLQCEFIFAWIDAEELSMRTSVLWIR